MLYSLHLLFSYLCRLSNPRSLPSYTPPPPCHPSTPPRHHLSSPPLLHLTILYFHGNAGNIGHRVPNALLMLVNLKANVVLVDYRGYGKSEGEPSEDGLYLDAEATLDYVMTRPDLDKTKVLLFGRSLGGAVAVRLASANPHRVAAIVVENTFLSIPHMAATLFSFVQIGRASCRERVSSPV